MEDGRGVEVARAGGTWETSERGETHGRVQGLAVLDAADGGTGSEMHDEEIEGAGVLNSASVRRDS